MYTSRQTDLMAVTRNVNALKSAELLHLESQYAAATKKALRAVMTAGTSSKDFLEAKEEAGVAARRIEEILGSVGSGKHWWRDNA